MNRPNKTISLLLLCVTAQFTVYPQENKKKQKEAKPAATTQTPVQVAPSPPKSALEFGLSEDTPVKIKLTRTMSSKDAKMGEKVDFEVLEDIKVKDVIVIQHGAMAIATVTKAQPKRSMGRSGKLDINIDYVQVVDGEKVRIRATKRGSGRSH